MAYIFTARRYTMTTGTVIYNTGMIKGNICSETSSTVAQTTIFRGGNVINRFCRSAYPGKTTIVTTAAITTDA